MVWSWTRISVEAADILSALETLSGSSRWLETNAISDWTPSNSYLEWSQECLTLKSPFGFDAAICYAKRAVCRQIDAFMVNNHLSYFLSQNYPSKLDLLGKVGLCVPDILHELVIGPRNEIEHEYQSSTEDRAKRAVQIAILFLRATAEDDGRQTVLSYNSSINFAYGVSNSPQGPIEKVEYSLRVDAEPILLVDVCDPKNHEVLVLAPKTSEMLVCPLKGFDQLSAVELAKRLRNQYLAGSYTSSSVDVRLLRLLREQLNFPNA